MSITELVDAVASWHALVLALVIWGFAPRAVLRLIVLVFHRDDPRRAEMLGEIHAVPRAERPFWVMEQLEVALFEGLYERLQWAAAGRITHRWHLGDGQHRHRQHPDTFYVPDAADLDAIRPGDSVKLMFERNRQRKGWGSGDRMWVKVLEVRGDRYVGELDNLAVCIPRLCPGQIVKFRREHIIDIMWADEADDIDGELGGPPRAICTACSGLHDLSASS